MNDKQIDQIMAEDEIEDNDMSKAEELLLMVNQLGYLSGLLMDPATSSGPISRSTAHCLSGYLEAFNVALSIANEERCDLILKLLSSNAVVEAMGCIPNPSAQVLSIISRHTSNKAILESKHATLLASKGKAN